MKPKKQLKDLNLMDRFLFAEAADDPEFMEILLSILFEHEIHLKHPPQTEKEVRSTVSQRQIRMDVWAKDEEGTIYNAEPQQKNTYNLPKRSRYYQSLMDSGLLEPGEINYNRLNDLYIIIIAGFDLFGQGLYRYTFRMSCEEVPSVRLEEGVMRIFLSTKGTDQTGVSQELIDLLRYFENTTDEIAEQSASLRIRKLQQKISAIKSSEDMGVKYMQAWEEKVMDRQEGFEEGHSAGLAEGHSQGLREGFAVLGTLVQDGILSLDQAADRLNGRRDEFLKWYEEQDVSY